jgi:hypothetical protein
MIFDKLDEPIDERLYRLRVCLEHKQLTTVPDVALAHSWITFVKEASQVLRAAELAIAAQRAALSRLTRLEMKVEHGCTDVTDT